MSELPRPTLETSEFLAHKSGQWVVAYDEKSGKWIALSAEESANLLNSFKRERDEAREQWRLSSVCREVTEQRDRLAEALEYTLHIMEEDGYGAPWTTKGRSALSALNPTGKEQSHE